MNFFCQACGKECDSVWSLASHIRWTHKLTKEKYAETYKTEEWFICPVCGDGFFIAKKWWKNLKYKACKKCRHEYKVKQMNLDGSYDKARQKQFSTMRKNGTIEERSKKRRNTMLKNGSDIIFAEKIRIDHAKNPEKYFGAAKKWTENRKERDPGFFSRKNKKMWKNRSKENVNSWVQKVHDTRKRNGTYRCVSNAELAFSWLAHLIFSDKNIFQQVKMNSEEGKVFLNEKLDSSFTSDIILKLENKIYIVPFDGLYYHGLKKNLKDINNTPQKKTIIKTIERDILFEKHCMKNNINLIRFNDINFESFINGKENLIPHFVCGKSDDIDFLFDKLNTYFKSHNLRKIGAF
jgi:hypothetical protein